MTFRWWVEEELTIDGTQYVVLQLRYIPPHIKLFHCTDTSGQHTTFLLQMVVLQPKIFSGCICICTYCNWSFQCCKVSKWRVRCEMMIWYSVVVYLVPGLGKCWIRPKTGRSAVREKERDSASELPCQCQRLAEWGNVAWPWWQTHSRLPAPTSTPGPGVAELSRGEPGHLLSDRLQPGHRWAIFGSPVLFWTPRPQSARIF